MNAFGLLRALACGMSMVSACLFSGLAAADSAADETDGLVGHPAIRATDWDATIEIVIELGDHAYAPDEFTLQVGKPYKLLLKNVGGVSHDMVGGSFFDEHTIALRMVSSKVGRVVADHIRSIYLRPQNDTELWLVPLKEGEFSFFCSLPFHREDGMEGVVRIVR